MQSLTFRGFKWFLIISLVIFGGFFYTQGAGAQAQRPDLRITKAAFDGLNLHVEYVNATGVGYPRVRYEVGFQWHDVSGSAVGTRHWLNVPEVARGGVAILDNKYRIDLTYQGRDGRNYNRTLAEFLYQRPDRAEELQVMVDDGNRVSETDESNNIARLRVPLPDLQITGAKFLAPNRLELSYRNANPSPIPVAFRIGFTWTQESGTHLTATRFMNVLEPAAGTTKTEILSRTDVSYVNDQRRQVGDRLDWYLEKRPTNATRLKITIDDAGTVREANEQNNLVSVRPDLPPPPSPHDLAIANTAYTPDGVTLTMTNRGHQTVDKVSLWFEWVDRNEHRTGTLYWYDVLVTLRPTVSFTFSGSTRQLSSRAVDGGEVLTVITDVLASPPPNATHLKVHVDGPNAIVEAAEDNNTVLLPVLRPDLTIEHAVLTTDRLSFDVKNAGTGMLPDRPANSLWFEWVDTSGVRAGNLYWYDSPVPLRPGVSFTWSEPNRLLSFNTGGGQTGSITIAEVLARPPDSATHLKVSVDGPNAIVEANEGNNVVLLRRSVPPLPDLTSDLRIADFTMDPIAPRAGERVFFIVRVDNVGSAATGQSTATGITVDPKNDGTAQKLIGQFTTENIPPGQSKTLRWTKENYYGWVAVEGTHTIEVCADRARVVQERDETNNCARKMVTVGKPLDEPTKLPDLTITKETLDGAALRYLYHNNGEGPAEPEVSFWYEWVDAQGKRVGDLYWINVGGMTGGSKREGNQLLDISTLEGEQGKIKLGDLVYYPPPGAYHLKLTIDGPNAHAESNEQNNSVLLPVLRTDFTITDAEFRNGFPWYKYHNRGNLGHPAGKTISFWFEWVDAGGARIGDLHWLEVDPPLILSARSASLARSTAFDGTTTVFSVKGPAKLAAFLNAAPNGAANLKITIDGPNAYAESDEGNNIALIDRAKFPSPESQLKKPDLTISRVFILPGMSWLAIEYKNLETAVGTPEFSWTVYWVDAAGKRLGTPHVGIGQALKPWGASGRSSDTDVPFGKWLAQPKPAGAARLEFVVDPENLIAETNETNNRATFEGWVPQDTTVQPDLTIVAAELKDDLLTFIYRNDGKGPANDISIWFHFANAVGVQIGPVYWLDVESLPAYRGRHFTSKDIIVGSDSGSRPLAEVLRQGPAEATHVKILIDGPHRILEGNEINNTALVEKPVRVAEKLPDLALTGGSRAGGVVRVTIVNGTTGELSAPQLQFKWLDKNDKEIWKSPISFWQHEVIPAGKTGDFTLEYEKWREDGVIYFLKHPPAGAVALLATIDPENKLKESNEDNNAFRIALGQPDLAYGTPVVRSGALIIPVINHGASASVATDMWLQWYGGGKWLPSTGAVDVPAIAPGATVEISVLLDRTFGADGPILTKPPATAERLRLFLDGLRKVDELDEQNNTVMLERAIFPKAEESAPQPDLAFTTIFVPPGSDRLVIGFENAGKAEAKAWEWQIRWLEAKGNPSGETYRGTIPGLKPNWRYGLGNDSQDLTGKPRPLGEFLRQIPAGATRIEVTIDPDNKVVEANESNNLRYFEVANFPPSLRASKTAPELKLTLTAEVVKAKNAAAASPLATAGFIMAFVALLSGAYMIHGHTSARGGITGFLKVFPLLLASSRDSYMFLRKCGFHECAGPHFDRHNSLKRMTRASLVVTLATGAVKISLALALTALSGPTELVSAAALEAAPGEAVRSTLLAKNMGSAAVSGLTLRLPCPTGTSWVSTRLNDREAERSVNQDLPVPDLKPTSSHRLIVVCKIEAGAPKDLRFMAEAGVKALGEERLYSNAVTVSVIKTPEPKELPPASEKPDLTVEGLGFLPLMDIIEKDRAPFEAIFSGIVSNKGKKASGAFRARVRVDHGGNGTWEAVSPALVEAPSIAAGGEALIKLPLQWTAPVGTYTFEICLDPGKNIDESDETNNCETDRFTLKVGEEPAQEEELIE